MFSSQPLVDLPKTPRIKRARSVGPLTPEKSYKMTANKSAMQIIKFENEIGVYIDRLITNHGDDPRYQIYETAKIEVKTEELEKRDTVHLSYFIGRLNPPHYGHIIALQNLVQDTNDKGGKALILLGSGPKKLKTMDNPIPYELKEEFIQSKLLPKVKDVDYFIQEMTNPFVDVSTYINKQLAKTDPDHIVNINIRHTAGDKEKDSTKLIRVLDASEIMLTKQNRNAFITTGVDITKKPPAEDGKPETYMSATNVRKDAYRTYDKNHRMVYDNWPEQYKTFYGKFAKKIYAAILMPLQNILKDIPVSERYAAVRGYIEEDIHPNKKTKKTKGGKRRKTRKRRKQII